MRCVLCNSEMVYTREENGEPYLYCWYCEEDAKEPEPYAGGMKPQSVFPLMDELEAEWGIDEERQFNWLESWPVTPVVAGSSPVRSAT